MQMINTSRFRTSRCRLAIFSSQTSENSFKLFFSYKLFISLIRLPPRKVSLMGKLYFLAGCIHEFLSVLANIRSYVGLLLCKVVVFSL